MASPQASEDAYPAHHQDQGFQDDKTMFIHR
jgi:hypothetical protein